MDFKDLFVSYHQMVVATGAWDGVGLGIYVVGGRLVQPTGPSQATVFAGPHTGTVQVRAAGMTDAPDDATTDWDAVEEVTLWAPDGQITVGGLMGEPLLPAPDLAAIGPGLYRVQVRARGRRPDGVDGADAQPEQFEILTWPVTQDRGHTTLRVDDLPDVQWDPQPARAAQLAMIGIITGSCSDPFDPNAARRAPERPTLPGGFPRVRVTRSAPVAGTGDTAVAALRNLLGPTDLAGTHVVPVGPLQVTLTPEHSLDGTRTDHALTLRWQWDWTSGTAPDPGIDDQAWAAQLTIPDTEAMTVEILAGPEPAGSGTVLAVRQHDVLACDAVQVGLIWEYYLAQAQAVLRGRPSEVDDPLPWADMLTELAVREANEIATQRRWRDENERSANGGQLLSPRLRELQAAVTPVAKMDRRLLDALVEAGPQRQRAVAVWAARQACTASRLVELDWIGRALSEMENGQPLPEAFHDAPAVWNRMWTDPATPSTVVVGPGGVPNCSQQAMALPALLDTADPDPLAAAVNALHTAAIVHGPEWPELLERARLTFPELMGADHGGDESSDDAAFD